MVKGRLKLISNGGGGELLFPLLPLKRQSEIEVVAVVLEFRLLAFLHPRELFAEEEDEVDDEEEDEAAATAPAASASGDVSGVPVVVIVADAATTPAMIADEDDGEVDSGKAEVATS